LGEVPPGETSMGSPGKAPGTIARTLVGWQAARIGDPVDRLRFLRHTVGDRRVWDPRSDAGREFWQGKKRPLMVVLSFALLLPVGTMTSSGRLWKRGPVVTAQASESGPETFPQVWQVEQTREYESYSNGLRIERKFETGNEPRIFEVYPRGAEDNGTLEQRSVPVGIVFHTTESLQEAFEEGNRQRLRRIGEALLRLVQEGRSYHYVVDRFGRVWRVVKESDSANHAGYSVWADGKSTYVNLNRSFIGVSVEAMTQPGSANAEATPAQIHALRVLVEMLRSKYRISALNCVTHAQVSVNPSNMQAGYHYDWAANFPYAQVGLPENYALPNPSLWLFGFTYDLSLLNVTGEAYWKGLVLGEEQLRQNATANGLSVPMYRQALEKRYRRVLSTMKARTELSKEKEG
jgi:hypothetical protein